MTHSETLRRICTTSAGASTIVATTTDSQAVLGFMAGSLYSLAKACQLEYQDRTGLTLPRGYPQELQEVLRGIANGELPSEGQWLAGFHLNSGLHRLAALYHRCLKILVADESQSAPALAQMAVESGLISRNEIAALATVHKEVNKLKHVTFGVLEGRAVDLDLAATACEQALMLVTLAVAKSSGRSA